MYKIEAMLILAGSVALAAAQSPQVTLHVGDSAPPMVIAKWAKGQPVTTLGNGNIDIVEFWATWCGPCRQSIPHLTELAKKYQGKATFIGVDSFEHEPNADKCYAKVEKFVADFGDKMNYNVAIDGVDGTMGKTWMEAAGQNGIPTAFIVDKQGKIAWIGHPMNLDDILGKVVEGSFDSAAEAAKQKKLQEQEQAEMAAQQALLKPILDARQSANYPAEVKAIDAAIAKKPELKQPLSEERLKAMTHYDEAGANKYAAELVAGALKDVPSGLNGIAWDMVEDKSAFKHPDLAVALKAAQRAYNLSNQDPMIGDTLALVYYRSHKLADAISVQKKAVAAASASSDFDADTLKEMKSRLAMYQKSAAAGKS